MKRAFMFLALLGAIILAGCGNSDTTSQSTFNNGSGNQPFKPVTHLDHRSLVTNKFVGQLQVFDTWTLKDKLTAFTFATGQTPTYMQPSPDSSLTFVNNTGSNTITSFNNNQEAVKGTISLNGSTNSFVTSNSNKFGFAAVANYIDATFRAFGAIVRFNPTDGSLNTPILFPHVKTIAMDPAQTHLLAFTDNDNTAYWVDFNASDDPKTSSPPYYALTLSGSVQLSNPVAAFFSSDSTKAYILSCGIECAGTQPASVTEIDVSALNLTLSTTIGVSNTGTATVVKQWLVNGAQNGYIDAGANKLYVVGGGSSTQNGTFTTINLADTTAVPSTVQIGNGGKPRIIRLVNGIFWVGARNCGPQSCITRVNPSNNTVASLPKANGDATGISLALNSGETYTVEGGEVFIYDKNANPFTSENPTDVRGQAWDVLYIN